MRLSKESEVEKDFDRMDDDTSLLGFVGHVRPFPYRAMLRCMANCTVKGKMVLPSGFTIPPPLPGKVWHVDRGVVTMKDDT